MFVLLSTNYFNMFHHPYFNPVITPQTLNNFNFDEINNYPFLAYYLHYLNNFNRNCIILILTDWW